VTSGLVLSVTDWLYCRTTYILCR